MQCNVMHCVMQALGNACFDLDPDQRPTFKQCIEQITSMLAALTTELNSADGLEARNQTRPTISGSDIPEALTCSSEAPVQTEASLPVVPANAAAVVPNSTAVAA